MGKKTDRILTYQDLRDLALQHYDDGGDATYECCDERWFNDYVKQFGPMTEKTALHMFEIDKQIARMREWTF